MAHFGLENLEIETDCRSLEPARRVGLTLEEFVLLKAIIYCHSGMHSAVLGSFFNIVLLERRPKSNLASPGLSDNARAQLEDARDDYSRTLLRRLQSTLTPEVGAKKYAEIIGLVDTYFHFTAKIIDFCAVLNLSYVMPDCPSSPPMRLINWATHLPC